MQSSAIAILMASYNGEKYLAAQMDSLLGQTFRDWHLYIHDDGSEDGTVALVQEYAGRYPEKITLLEYPPEGSACRNFLSLLERVEAPYYMFCDQDDVWKEEKIALEWAQMKKLEEAHPHQPILVNSDLTVVDATLQTIHPSFWQYRNIRPDFVRRFEDFSATNIVTGCTMLFNRQVKSVVKKPYTRAMMHDAWITLCVVADGGILHNMETPTVLYRQHGYNTIGAMDARVLTLKYRLLHFREMITISCRQFLQLNAISRVSLFTYIHVKLRYRKYLREHKRL